MLIFAGVFGIANGLATIVKGTAMATYVDRAQVASLNGVLGIPNAVCRSLAPFMLGSLWTPSEGYQSGLYGLLLMSVVAVLCFFGASSQEVQPPST